MFEVITNMNVKHPRLKALRLLFKGFFALSFTMFLSGCFQENATVRVSEIQSCVDKKQDIAQKYLTLEGMGFSCVGYNPIGNINPWHPWRLPDQVCSANSRSNFSVTHLTANVWNKENLVQIAEATFFNTSFIDNSSEFNLRTCR